MTNNVIRKNADGVEVNFGPLVVAELDGIKFVLEDWRAQQLGVGYEEGVEIPPFLDDLKIVVNWRNTQIFVYPLKKEDIRVLGRALSTLGSFRIDAEYYSRILMMWEDGCVTSEHKTIDHFYSGMTEEQIERSRF